MQVLRCECGSEQFKVMGHSCTQGSVHGDYACVERHANITRVALYNPGALKVDILGHQELTRKYAGIELSCPACSRPGALILSSGRFDTSRITAPGLMSRAGIELAIGALCRNCRNTVGVYFHHGLGNTSIKGVTAVVHFECDVPLGRAMPSQPTAGSGDGSTLADAAVKAASALFKDAPPEKRATWSPYSLPEDPRDW